MENDGFRSQLSAYKDGELDGELSEEMSLHLRNCAACREELAELERVDSLVKDMPKLELDESFFLQIIAGISTKEQDRPDSAPFSKRVFARFLQLAHPCLKWSQDMNMKGPPPWTSSAIFHLFP